MGCDIHIKAEYKKNSLWHLADDPIVDCDMCNQTGKDSRDPNKVCYWCRGSKRVQREIYDNRCYDLFSILANVRNGYGFAGCKTGDGFVPMTSGRGIPPDVSDEGESYLNEYGADGHSHTYMTLKEIYDYDWDQVTWKEGVVSPAVFKEWLDRGKKGYPIAYSGGVGGPNVVMVSPELMEEKIIKGEIVVTPERIEALRNNQFFDSFPSDPNAPSYYTTVRWASPYSEVREQSGFNKTLDLLKKLAEEQGVTYDNVRLIMFFDN